MLVALFLSACKKPVTEVDLIMSKPIALPKFLLLASLLILSACGQSQDNQTDGSAVSDQQSTTEMVEFTDAEIEELVRHSYQNVAMFNVNNKFAIQNGGWNFCVADTALKDHTMREIARPNNDSLCIICMLDLRKDPVILAMPAFDSSYVSLMVTGYDHYVNVPRTTRLGGFQKAEKLLF